MKPLRYLEIPLVHGIVGLLQLLPLKCVRKIARGLGYISFSFLASRKKVARENLMKAFPHMSAKELDPIVREVFRSIAVSFFELLWLPRFNESQLRSTVKVSGIDHITRYLEERRGVVILISHFANWELAAQRIAVEFPGKTAVIYKPQSNSSVDKLIYKIRSRFGIHLIPMAQTVKESLIHLAKGDIVILAADQTASKESAWVPFFGREIPTFKGPAALALRSQSPLMLLMPHRKDDGDYEGELMEVSSEGIEGYNENGIYELTRRHAAATEKIIREHLGQWMWTHKRWKHESAPHS